MLQAQPSRYKVTSLTVHVILECAQAHVFSLFSAIRNELIPEFIGLEDAIK